jgi:hypothetical protein
MSIASTAPATQLRKPEAERPHRQQFFRSK